MMVDHASRKPRSSEKLLFPVVGVVTGLLTFAGLQFLWPLKAAAPKASETIATAAPTQQPQKSGPLPVLDLRTDTGNGAVTVSWTISSGVQGSYITKAIPEDKKLETRECTTLARSCVIDGLTNGASYTIEVRSEDNERALSAPRLSQAMPHPDILASESSALWLDANDTSTVGDSAAEPGSPVSKWRDKSGRGYVAAQTEPPAQPLVTTLGKLRALKFSGNQNLTFGDSRLPSGSEPSTLFVVARLDDPNAAASCFEHLLAWGSAQPGGARIVYKGCSTPMGYVETYDTNKTMQPTKEWPVGKMALLSATVTKAGIGVRMNGSPSYSWATPSDVQTNTAPRQTVMVGGAPWWKTQAGWVGSIGELVVLSGEISTGQQAEVEQYLIRKWSIS
ncbi:fibronectin type III domain-containing protein [Frankia sp. Cr1]|uniref:fibronectin type III domain-containing protein n=1 Tax=Frankia sp. Cr1 TaxID=3073931 RepID=UPI002AD5458E|nr:fibronectin type III domain-containing protein [Frankia sp. Cr1]